MTESPANGLPAEDHYLTLAQPAASEHKIQRSRFIGLATPIVDATAAKAWVQEQERQYHDARHVCFAWRTGHHGAIQEIRSDAGEPTGTAGEPLLAALRKSEVTDAIVVVVRYFGGIKLGTGGLARAYGQAAEGAVAKSGTRIIHLGRLFDLVLPYNLRKTLEHLLRQCRGEIRSEAYAEDISWRIWLPNSQCDSFAARLRENTAGAVALKEAGREPEHPDPS